MSLLSRSIPGLFGGVSQQTAAMRHATQGDLQENGIATLVDGLSKREGIQHIASLAMTGANSASVQGTSGDVFAHVIDRGSLGRYLLIIKNGNLMAYDLATGAAKTVAFPDGKTYLNASTPSMSFRAVTVADYTFIVNRGVTTAMTASVGVSPPIYRGVVYLKQIVQAATYTINVDGHTAQYTADGSPTSKEIIDGLVDALAIALPPGYTLTVVGPPNATEGPVISITKDDHTACTVSCSDDYGNLALISVHQSVVSYADLPPNLNSLTDFITKVSANPANDKGSYYVKWDPTNQEYIECIAPGSTDTLDADTLPHKLVVESGGDLTFSKISDWTKRKSGDDTSNPIPSFVGSTINDVFFLRNRLGFLSQDNVILSKSGHYYTFFGDSAQQVLDTDPIDLASTTSQVVSLEWAVEFNQDLLIWSEKRQFILTGGDVMTPKTARLAPTTAFEAFIGCNPVPLANKCVFTATSGDYTSIRMMRVASDTVTNKADEITEHIPRYISAYPRQLAASTAAKMIVVLPAGTASKLFVFKYEDGDNEQLSQKAWCTFTCDDTSTQSSFIVKAYWVERRLYLLRWLKDTNDAVETGGRFMLELLDFQSVRTDTEVDFSLRLDRKVQPTNLTLASTNTTMKVPYWERTDMTILKCVSTKAPVVLPVTSTVFNSDGTMTLTVAGDQTAETLWAGKGFLFKYRFTESIMRDSNEQPIQNSRLTVKRFLVKYVNTGFFRARVTPYLRNEYVYDFSGNVLGSIPLEAPQLATGEFNIPVHARPEGTTVEIESDSFFPATFPYAEWMGNVVMQAQR